MVSTRQMTNVGGSSSGSDEPETTSRPQRHNSVITIVSSASSASLQSTIVPLATTSHHYVPPQTINFLNLPQEIIEKILVYLGYKKIAQMRSVCRQMNQICGSCLNSTFSRLQTQMLCRFQSIKAKMPRRESARRSHPLACESDIIETLHMRLTLLQMTFGKHIERKHCCFFPGEILDEVYRILQYIRVTQKLARPYKVTDELFDLSTMAMEYFKERIEPALPEIAYFGSDFLDFTGTFSGSVGKSSYLCLDDAAHSSSGGDADGDGGKLSDGDAVSSPQHGTGGVGRSPASSSSSSVSVSVSAVPPTAAVTASVPVSHVPPQSNMVLRKRIRKIKQGMKRYNNQLSVLRNDLRTCKRKTAEQQRQISEQQKQLAEQQKQTLEYATRLDENDKKNEETSRKFSTLLQELNKCKTELQYWRSKSPATPPVCTGCGAQVAPLAQEDLKALVNQGVKPEDVCLLDHEGDVSVVTMMMNDVEQQQQQQQVPSEDVSLSPDDVTTTDLNVVPSVSGEVANTKTVAVTGGVTNKRKMEDTPTSSHADGGGVKKLRRGLKSRGATAAAANNKPRAK